MEETMKRLSLSCAALAVGMFGAGAAIADTPPPGSYQQSCYSITYEGGTLTATCLTITGTGVSTRLPFANRCNGDIANINGSLICQ
jgi:hypothetical protein